MNNKQIICDGCDFYFDEAHLFKNKSGKNYCINCNLIISNIKPSNIKPISKKDFDKMLKTLSETPPLKLKDLKDKLKKEREKKQNYKSKKGSK